VGNGTRVRYWKDLWVQNNALLNTFPNLYNISNKQKELIANMGWFEGEAW